MQPTQLALVIHKGATFRARLRVMQPTPVYRDITAIIAAAPVQLTVDHGLPTDWPIWIERVRQLTALNRAPIQQQPHFARVVDAETLEISTINAAGTNGTGGQIVYYPPLPLAGATAELTLYDKGAAVDTLPVTVDAAGWVDAVLTDEQTEALEWSALEYTLDVQLGSTDVLRVYAGKVTAIAAGTTPATCQGFAVIGADRGPPGPTVSTMVVDDDGYLIITLEDGTVITSPEPLNRPWGTIVGDITTQLDLMGLLNAKTDLNDFLAFVQQTVADLAARYTKDEADQELADAIATRTTPAEAAAAAPVQTVQGRTGAVTITKSDLALDNVDNTSDANKPLSDAATAALALKLNTALKGADNGLAELDNDGKVPLSQISDAVLGQLSYQGLWDASTNTPNLPSTPAQKGDYYIASVGGTRFGLEFDVGDWLVSDGAAWGKVDNTDAVASVNGKKGVVTLTKADVGLGNADNTSDLNKPVSTAQQTALDLKVDKVPGKRLSTEDFTTAEKTKLSNLPATAERPLTAGNNISIDRTDPDNPVISSEAGGSSDAVDIGITDVGAYYASATVEGALQELGAMMGDVGAALDAINGEVV